jgi:hypothetical protein
MTVKEAIEQLEYILDTVGNIPFITMDETGDGYWELNEHCAFEVVDIPNDDETEEFPHVTLLGIDEFTPGEDTAKHSHLKVVK